MSRKPSPSLVVSIIALVFAAAGTSIAAVNFAKNAGAVDGKSAVGAASSSKRAAGKLVATYAGGASKGKIPARFLEIPAVSGFVPGSKQTFAQSTPVNDNQSNSPVALATVPGLGILTMTCADQNNKAAMEDPRVTVTFANGAGGDANFSRSVAGAAATVGVVANGAQTSLTIGASNEFHFYVAYGSTHFVYDGVVRQQGEGTADAACVVWGSGLVL